jgi:hypothetical protein
MSEQKRTALTFIGMAALYVAGVLKALTHFVPHSTLGSLALSIIMAAAALTGTIALAANTLMSGELGVARAVQRRKPATALAFAAIYLAFASVLFGSLYWSSEKIRFAGDVALWFALAFMLWDTWQGSRQLPGSA